MSEDNMRDRLILPVLIPVGALAFILFLALLMSQILLNVHPYVATAVAISVAINLLISFSVMAAKPDGGRPLMVVLSAITALPLLFGVAAAAGLAPAPEEEEHGGGGEAGVELAASGLAFDKTELTIPADTEFVLAFNNEESQPHNVAILEAQGSPNALFRGAIVTGPKLSEETVDPIPAGEYYFQCDVHPNMSGTVKAVEGGGEGEAAEGEAAGGDAAAGGEAPAGEE
ncbi:MAG TPA: cupredoxin domain-containing protein [Actinomycetota bacterium]|jgi:plastocyanin|nr:cupredoxin domain-containing protein [Actinomycetota bacterium]